MKTAAIVLLALCVLAIITALAVTGYGAKVTAFIVPIGWGAWCLTAGARNSRIGAR